MDGLMLISPARTLASSCIVFLLQICWGVWLHFQASHSPRVAAGHARHSHLRGGASWHLLASSTCTPGWNRAWGMAGWLLKLCPKREEIPVLCPPDSHLELCWTPVRSRSCYRKGCMGIGTRALQIPCAPYEAQRFVKYLAWWE